LPLYRKIGNLLCDPVVSYCFKYFFVVLAFLDYFIYKKQGLVSITGGEIWVSE
jgi:hypothetical protein